MPLLDPFLQQNIVEYDERTRTLIVTEIIGLNTDDEEYGAAITVAYDVLPTFGRSIERLVSKVRGEFS